MTETIIKIIENFASSYVDARSEYKNEIRKKHYEKKEELYSRLLKILPVDSELTVQADYMKDVDISGDAESKIESLKIRISELEKKIDSREISGPDKKELRTEINNYRYMLDEHKKYLSSRRKLLDELKEFEKFENELDIYASKEVCKWYYGFTVSIENEYMCDFGVTKDQILNNLRMLKQAIKYDLNEVG